VESLSSENISTGVVTGACTVKLLNLGITSYKDTWDLQKKIQRSLIEGTGEEKLILCSHHPVITIGKSGDKSNLLASEQTLKEKNISFFEIERGGDITFHSPEQIILYPILSLENEERDVGKYMRNLEEVIIRTLKDFSIPAVRNSGKTGVWVENNAQLPIRKISSIGVKMSRWKTLHGASLNVLNCQKGFDLITPCGINGVLMTSIEEELKEKISFNVIEEKLVKNFVDVFNRKIK